MYEVVRVFIDRNRAAVARAQVFEQFDSRAGRCPQCSDPQPRAENIVEMLLLGSIVFARSRDSQAEQIVIEPKTGVGVGDHDGGVVDSQKQPVACVLPPGITFTLGELQNLHGMFIGVFEVESLDAARVFVPIRQTLRARGSVLDFVLPQNRIRTVHIADDDGDVLKPHVVASGIDGNGAALGSQKLQKLDGFASQLQCYDSHARPEYAKEVLDLVSRNLSVRHLFEGQNASIEINGAIHVLDGYRDGSYRSNMNLLASSRDRRKSIGLRSRSSGPNDAEGDRKQEGTECSRQHAVVLSQ